MQKIMIDGVNVADCIYHSGHLQEYLGTNKCEVNGRCEREKNCYYKQLQRLKENYRLGCLECEYKNTKADVDKYKQALEEIRDKNKKLKKLIADYKQALKEIKNISDDYNLTVNKRRDQIADIVNSLLE